MRRWDVMTILWPTLFRAQQQKNSLLSMMVVPPALQMFPARSTVQPPPGRQRLECWTV